MKKEVLQLKLELMPFQEFKTKNYSTSSHPKPPEAWKSSYVYEHIRMGFLPM